MAQQSITTDGQHWPTNSRLLLLRNSTIPLTSLPRILLYTYTREGAVTVQGMKVMRVHWITADGQHWPTTLDCSS